MKKAVGYILAIIGLVLLVIGLGYLSVDNIAGKFSNSTNSSANYSEINDSVNKVPQYIFTIAGAALILVGIVLLYKNPTKTKKHQEVPIYSGNQVIGYRRQ